MRYSRHIYHFSYFPKTLDANNWIDNINKETEAHNIDLIMPICEHGIEMLLKHKDQLLFKDKLCLLPDYKCFMTANNKWNLVEHLSINNIPFPKTILFSKYDSLKFDHLSFPVIVKPILESGGGEGVHLFDSKEELQNYLLNNKQLVNKLIIQKYVTGYDIGCSVLCKSGSILAFTIQKATMANSKPFGPLLGAKFVYDEDLYKTIENLMKSLNWSGVSHIDLRYDMTTKEFKVIEINARYWGSLDASLIAGINFPNLYCLASLNKTFDSPEYRFIDYLNLKGLFKSFKKNIFLIFNFKFILSHTPVVYAIYDPLPTIVKYSTYSKNILAGKVKNLFKSHPKVLN